VAYWLMKTEPGSYSWDDLVKDGRTHWNGVRNHQAANNMKAMKIGDRVFIYHSVDEKRIVGIAEVVKEYYPDHTDESGRFGMVDIKPIRPMAEPVTLARVKSEPKLADLLLVRHTRLSVMPIDAAAWALICRIGKTAD